MTSLKYLAIFAVFYLTVAPVWAVTVVECEDSQGNRSFQDRCPPGTTPIDKKQYSVTAPEQKKGNLSATLYVIPECDSCDQVKEFLELRHISITEKDVSGDFKLQEELKEKTGGDLHVPVLILGEKVLKGYNRAELLQALADAGYTSDENQQ